MDDSLFFSQPLQQSSWRVSCHVEATDVGETIWRERCSRGCKIATYTKPGRFDYQLVLSVAEFKFHCVKLGEHWSKLLKFGSTKHGETCCQGFERTQRANFSSVAGRSGQTQKARRDLLREPTSEPPTKIWPVPTFPYRQNIGRTWKGF